MYREIFNRLLPCLKEVSEFIGREYVSFNPAFIETKGYNDLVSYVDKNAEAMLVEACSKIIPNAGFINEESGSKSIESEFVWIIDPLDGTTNFTQKIPFFSISVALMHQGELVLGIVHEVNRHETFYAFKGEGAFLNDTPIHVTNEPHLSQVVIATGFPYSNFQSIESYLEMLKEFMQKTRGLRRLGSAALDLAYTACGRFGGFFETNLKTWDIAAGTLIVREAGGIVNDFSGSHDLLFNNSIIATTPTLYPQMMSIIQRTILV